MYITIRIPDEKKDDEEFRLKAWTYAIARNNCRIEMQKAFKARALVLAEYNVDLMACEIFGEEDEFVNMVKAIASDINGENIPISQDEPEDTGEEPYNEEEDTEQND